MDEARVGDCAVEGVTGQLLLGLLGYSPMRQVAISCFFLYYDFAVARLLRFVARSWKQQFASRGGLLYV